LVVLASAMIVSAFSFMRFRGKVLAVVIPAGYLMNYEHEFVCKALA
jgi:hypothetical protein